MSKEDYTQLIEFAELDGTEWGEMILEIDRLWQYRSHMGVGLTKALESEMRAQWKWAKNNLTIVETTETITRPVRTLEQL
jgi:hypothetical protein